MSTTNNSSMTLVAIQAALQAGEILKRGFGTLYQITAKPGKQNIVTEYDHAAEACIVRLIKQHFPSHSILAEEMGHFKAQDQTIVWYIDPLDGTTNFAKHIPIFTISIAAYQEQKGLCAVIWQPLTQELFIAERGKGAYLNGTPLSISSTQKIADAIIGVGSPYPLEDSH
jgi:myo-inositol-1(or 4)-monophosphatase